MCILHNLIVVFAISPPECLKHQDVLNPKGFWENRLLKLKFGIMYSDAWCTCKIIMLRVEIYTLNHYFALEDQAHLIISIVLGIDLLTKRIHFCCLMNLWLKTPSTIIKMIFLLLLIKWAPKYTTRYTNISSIKEL